MERKRLLFVLNPFSGTKGTDYKKEIENHFSLLPQFEISFITPNWAHNPSEDLEAKLSQNSYDAVIASGGDGTVRFVAEILYGRDIIMGILPTGSANGLAKNLKIDENITKALSIIEKGEIKRVSSLTINNKFCIHIADTGLNASIVRRFERLKRRGLFGYAYAFFNVIFKQRRVVATIIADEKKYVEEFYMLVFANGTGYGTGLPINPNGRLDDNHFEIIKVEKLSLIEALRLYLGKDKPNPDIAAILPCRNVQVKFNKPVHLQVDGEYIGKTCRIKVDFNDFFIPMIVP